MTLPFHTKIGIGAVGLAISLGLPSVPTFVAVLLLGLLHELYDGDIKWKQPLEEVSYNGWDDVLDFLPAPVAYLLAQSLVGAVTAVVFNL